jgi:hypothetical protein
MRKFNKKNWDFIFYLLTAAHASISAKRVTLASFLAGRRQPSRVMFTFAAETEHKKKRKAIAQVKYFMMKF